MGLLSDPSDPSDPSDLPITYYFDILLPLFQFGRDERDALIVRGACAECGG